MRVSSLCRRFALVSTLAGAVGACKSTEARVPTTLVVTPGTSLSFTALGQTQQLSVRVSDQNGDSVAGVVPVFTSTDATVASVTPGGLVAAVKTGGAAIQVSAAGLATDVSVSVAQVIAQVQKLQGDGQGGTVGAALGSAMRVRVNDGLSNRIPGASVAFTVTSGGGSVSAASVTADALGEASVTWTLGTVAGQPQTLAVSAGSAPAVLFSATAIAGVVAAIVKLQGDNQTGAENATLPVAPRVRVTDSFGNVKASQTVIFSASGADGSVTGGTQVTSAAGEAAAGAWTLGPGTGTKTLGVSVQGTAVTGAFSATAVLAGSPASIAAFVGDNQTALVGYPTNIRPAVRVTDAGALPVSGVSVTFAVESGSGSVTDAIVVTDGNGVAQVGSWTVGASPGANTVSATAAPGGIIGNPVTFTATGAAATFVVDIRNTGRAFLPAEQAAFDAAKQQWERTVYVAQPAFSLNAAAGDCGSGSPAVNEPSVTGVIILARIEPIDGPFGILGSAGPCFVRIPGSASTIMGTMRFDSADVAMLAADGRLNDVIIHEMGHVLGIGTLWNLALGGFSRTCRQNTAPTPGDGSVDTYYNCAGGLAAFDSIGGTGYTGGNKVPVENTGGAGTANGHWRESTFDNELMTGFVEAAGIQNPMSLLTVQSVEDLGYTVNYAARGAYARVFSVGALTVAGAAAGLDLGDDVYRGPIYGVDRYGRKVAVFRP